MTMQLSPPTAEDQSRERKSDGAGDSLHRRPAMIAAGLAAIVCLYMAIATPWATGTTRADQPIQSTTTSLSAGGATPVVSAPAPDCYLGGPC